VESLFAVDVETSGLIPGRHDLLSVGIVEVHTDARLHVIRDDIKSVNWDPDTRRWWESQEEAWGRLRYLSHVDGVPLPAMMSRIQKFVADFPGPRFLVANPSSFDVPFLNVAFHDTGVESLFHHRTLDVRSWVMGKYGTVDLTASLHTVTGRDRIEPVPVPHDALADAEVVAKMLRDAANIHHAA
jgi:DNA polymerase III epsilon subunit-like protein